MRPDLHAEITRRLVAEYGFKTHGRWLQKGKCPECGHSEMYTSAEKPWMLRCGRANNCGAEIKVKDVFSDLFESWSDRYVATETDPTAAADAYLQFNRGFCLNRLRGLYTQDVYAPRDLGISSATVRFALPGGSYWERIIDRPERFGKRKANFGYGTAYQGLWWEMPDTVQMPNELWLAEGIFKAIALELNGIPARALLSCVNYPEKALQALAAQCREANVPRPKLVWALDDDEAGKRYTLEFVERARKDGWECDAAQPPAGKGGEKLDWDELHARGRMAAKDVEEYRHLGALLIAKTPRAKGKLIHKRSRRNAFHFEFRDRLFWFAYDPAKAEKARGTSTADEAEDADDEAGEAATTEDADAQAITVTEICNVHPVPLYYMRNDLTDEAWYQFRVNVPWRKAPMRTSFTALQLSSAPEFCKRLIHSIAGADFYGSPSMLKAYYRETCRDLKEVKTIDFIGYSAEHKCYVFSDYAVKDGVVYPINADEYFEMGRLSIKTLTASLKLAMNPDLKAFRTDWVDALWRCYGPNGLIALAYWLGSLFAEQIRAAHEMFPFLEMSGAPGAGKSALIALLWKLVGRTGYEGIDPTKSTLAGRSRTFLQTSNIPVVLVEADRADEKSREKPYDFDELKPLLNGRFGRAIGVKTAGTNDTYEPPFRASIVIEQNAQVTGSQALLERIIYTHYDKSRHTPENRRHAHALNALTVDELSGFALLAVRKEKQLLEIVAAERTIYSEQLTGNGEVTNYRIADTHALMMALVDCLRLVLKIDDAMIAETHEQLRATARQRQELVQDDPPVVAAFWELFDHLEGTAIGADRDGQPERILLNHSGDPEQIWINLPHFEQVVNSRRLTMPCDLITLKRELPKSTSRKFVTANAKNRSAITGYTKSVWVFKAPRN
ncbi:toprim domain-containing protein [Lysobacter brunescens]|uniref:Toprim domain-containing protein n=1 Tax=Lysobacter brunescens TaxID=262323 RepID=A0ABW2YF27_9GAMM